MLKFIFGSMFGGTIGVLLLAALVGGANADKTWNKHDEDNKQ